MKKITSLFICILLIMGISSVPAFSSTVTRSIPNVRITITTSGMEFGEGLDETPMSYVNVPDNQYYELDSAEWLDDVSTIMPGSSPRLLVRLEAIPKEASHSNYDLIYLFNGTYTTSNVSITKGTFESATIQDSGYILEVTLKMNSLSGTFNPPQSADWTTPTGTATWTANTVDSGYHDIMCMRGNTTVKKLTNYHGVSYNFYPYMTEEGSYIFKIRTVPDPSSSAGKSSDWLESGELFIDKNNVSDGSGQTTADENGGSQAAGSITNSQYPDGTGNNAVVGWVTQNGYKYFFYPNGQCAKNEWMKLNGVWYKFDASGHMLTGWQKNNSGKWFYLDPATGAMKTGWFKEKGVWYFLDTTTGDPEGHMVTGWLNWKDERYYLNDSGHMVTGWFKVDGSFRYFYPSGNNAGKPEGSMAHDVVIDNLKLDSNGAWQ